jgi:hypothetical protein
VEPLGYTNTVSTSISFHVEVAAMPGFEFSIPNKPCLGPVPGNYATVYAQSSSAGPVLMENDPGSGPMPASLCVGEKINSIKQLMTRAFWNIVLPASSTSVWTVTTAFTTSTTATNEYRDLFDYFLPWFTFIRGGMHWKIIAPDGIIRAALHAPRYSALPAKGNGIFPPVGNAFEKRELLNLYFPQYSAGVARLVGYTNGSLLDFPSESTTFSLTVTDSTGKIPLSTAWGCRTLADESQLLGFACCPLQVLTPNTMANDKLT